MVNFCMVPSSMSDPVPSANTDPGACLNAPWLANGGIYLYASPFYPTPIYLYTSPCFPTPINLYPSPCRPTPIYQRLPLLANPHLPLRLLLLAETTPASLQPQHQTAAPNYSPTPNPSRRAFPDIRQHGHQNQTTTPRSEARMEDPRNHLWSCCFKCNYVYSIIFNVQISNDTRTSCKSDTGGTKGQERGGT
ncbi:unnamed protein product [Boreogadus saida]